MGFARKVARKQKKRFMKEFKEKMKHFKEQVKCSRCDHRPLPGENIDNWHIDKDSQGIDLVCEECHSDEEQPEVTP